MSKHCRHGKPASLAMTALTVVLLSAAALPSQAWSQDGIARATTAASSERDDRASDETAALPDATNNIDVSGPQLPRPLDAINADRYREIFRAQARGNYKAADNVMSELTDQSLVGNVLASRYLSRDYKSSAKELSDWLKHYSSLPDAPAVYALAQRKGAGKLTKPTASTVVRMGSPDESVIDTNSNWQAGLAAWRKRDYTTAAARFAEAYEKGDDPWNKSAAAYWVGRSYLRAKQPAKVSAWLVKAAKQPRTFYGQLAIRALGTENTFDWRTPSFNERYARAVLGTRGGKRALALLQVGQVNQAEKELLVLQQDADDTLSEALLSLSQASRMPSLALRIGANTRMREGKIISAALYPLPSWRPSDGFDVDRALLYAIMRQESGFNPEAVNSSSGAAGLMQLMPSTAKLVAGSKTANIKDPIVSMEIGQQYINQLTADENVGNNLLKMVIAYNAGPGNLAKWFKSTDAEKDPLLFVETLPSSESRLFVERVVAAYWIYRQRLGQDATSIDAIASGEWPKYHRQDVAKVIPDRRKKSIN
ncbi:lytic transglycosylase domain-containing protein [Dongia soli]|uniref:Lytic transglycosylase domain-containing protein n=1 Tax=Dongia soli TaxID=600628 RepID=A0ABU5ECA7_9PROT|nr:lytic transglycosylase domain-containing protein [Dongia soli]MDY0883934.1 lytic transglycosylase domain-containing protein [Dongia soli]